MSDGVHVVSFRCSRCGVMLSGGNECSDAGTDSESATSELVDCQQRQIANLQALLRSATRRLEHIRDELDSVLEAWS